MLEKSRQRIATYYNSSKSISEDKFAPELNTQIHIC